MNLLLFGGSFDPVHRGHLAMAAQSLLRLDLDRVMFVPARRSPLKQRATRASDAERLHWLRLATTGIPWAEIADVELHHEPPSYSWQTVAWASGSWPAARLHWLIGSDQWQQLDAWARIDFLDDQLTWVVCGRGAEPLEAVPGRRARFLPDFDHPASSTAIRAALARGGGNALAWLPPPIRNEVLDSTSYLPVDS